MTTQDITGTIQPRVMMMMMNTDQEVGSMAQDNDRVEAPRMDLTMKETDLETEEMALQDKCNLVSDTAAWSMQINRIPRIVHDSLLPTQTKICEKCSCQTKGKNLLLMYRNQELWTSIGKRKESK